MSLPFHLGLRADRHVLSVIKQNGRTREQLGVAYPQESDPRRRILKQWGIDDASPRRTDPDTIDLPLARRTQTILSYQLNPALRRQLNTGMGSLSGSRRDSQSGLRGRTHLGTSRPLMATRPHGFQSIDTPSRGGASFASVPSPRRG
ncbi:MAG: hypothetical protein ACJ8J7_16305 [Sulfurifustaceae bacterium]